MTRAEQAGTTVEQRGLWFEEFEIGTTYLHRPGEGIVTLEHIARNQDGDVVARAVRATLVQKRPTATEPTR